MTIPAESSSRTPGRHATGLLAKFRKRSVAAIAATAILAASSGGAPAVAKEESPQARVWLTTVDQSQLLAEQAPVPFGSAASSHPTIVIDPETTYQTMDGFGASITDSSAAVLSALSPAERDATMRKLFDPEPVSASVSCASPWAPPTSPRQRSTTPTTTCHRARQTSAWTIQHRTRRGADPAPAAPGERTQPRAQDRRHAMEPAGMDEDRRFPQRRAVSRPASLMRTRTPNTSPAL